MLHLSNLARFWLLIFCGAVISHLSCSSPQKKDTQAPNVLSSIPSDPAAIDQLLVDFIQDSTLQYEGAYPPLDAALLEYQRTENAANLQLFYKYHKNFNGSRERQFLWDTHTGELLFIEEKRVRKACPGLDQNCMSWLRAYFSSGQLMMVKVFRDTIADGTYPSFDHGEPMPVEDLSPYDTLLSSFKAIQQEADTIEWKEGVPIQGEYTYFADAAHFVNCRDGEGYDVASTLLEFAYIELSSGEMEPAITDVIGYFTPLPNMENKMRPHLVVLQLIEMRPGENCP